MKIDDTENDMNVQYNLKIVSGKGTPELSIIDYLIGESRYFDALKDKFGTITNLYGDDLK